MTPFVSFCIICWRSRFTRILSACLYISAGIWFYIYVWTGTMSPYGFGQRFYMLENIQIICCQWQLARIWIFFLLNDWMSDNGLACPFYCVHVSVWFCNKPHTHPITQIWVNMLEHTPNWKLFQKKKKEATVSDLYLAFGCAQWFLLAFSNTAISKSLAFTMVVDDWRN